MYFPPANEVVNSSMEMPTELFWWEDPKFIIGKLTKRERTVFIFNTMTATRQEMKVFEEDPLSEIREKYRIRYNSHMNSYCMQGSRGDMLHYTKTLTDNGFHYRHDPVSFWIYYNDNFTVA